MEKDIDVNIASIYRDLSDAINTKNKNIKKLLNSIKKASEKGEYDLKIKVKEDIREFLRKKESMYYSVHSAPATPRIIKDLTDLGFKCYDGGFEYGLFSKNYYMRISWQ